MTQDISGFGAVLTLVASFTFPAGIVITQFADDADPADLPSIQIGDKAMGLNGDLLTWRRGTPLPSNPAGGPGSDDDATPGILARANRAARGRRPANDVTTATIVYPDGSVITLSQGTITDAPFGRSISSAG